MGEAAEIATVAHAADGKSGSIQAANGEAAIVMGAAEIADVAEAVDDGSHQQRKPPWPWPANSGNPYVVAAVPAGSITSQAEATMAMEHAEIAKVAQAVDGKSGSKQGTDGETAMVMQVKEIAEVTGLRMVATSTQ